MKCDISSFNECAETLQGGSKNVGRGFDSFNSLGDQFADLQSEGVFRDFDHEGLFINSWNPPYPHLKFYNEFDFDTFEL